MSKRSNILDHKNIQYNVIRGVFPVKGVHNMIFSEKNFIPVVILDYSRGYNEQKEEYLRIRQIYDKLSHWNRNFKPLSGTPHLASENFDLRLGLEK